MHYKTSLIAAVAMMAVFAGCSRAPSAAKLRQKTGLADEIKVEKPQQIQEIMETSLTKATETFSYKGFYLGMPIEHAKALVSYYLPKSRVVITKKNNIEIDVKHGGLMDVDEMFFCRADESGNVRLFNFDRKRFLNNWFSFDTQTDEEWALAIGQFFDYDLRKIPLEGKRKKGWLWASVSQDSYRYQNNAQGYVATVFGTKHGEHSFDASDVNEAFMNDPTRAGYMCGLAAWVAHGWENGKGGRTGTLRIEIMSAD